MFNFHRRNSSTQFCLLLLGTLVVVLVQSYLAANPRVPLSGPPTRSLAAVGPATGAARPAPVTTAGGRPDTSQLLAAGDGHEVWVVRPIMGENNSLGYELLRRAANTGIWRPSMRIGINGIQTFWNSQGMPRGLALLQAPSDQPGASTPYIFCDSTVPGALGWVYAGSLEGSEPRDPLPANHIIKAVAGGRDQLFVITLGTPLPSTTRPGDPLHADMSTPAASMFASSPATTAASPATATSPASAPASQPMETTATAPVIAAAPAAFNTYWYPPTPPPASTTSPAPDDTLRPPPGDWCFLPPLGTPPGSATPTASSIITLVENNGRLLAIWVDPLHPADLVIRTLNYTRKQPEWSAPIVTHLADNNVIPAGSRLFTVALDKTLYVLWTVPTGATIELHGGWLKADPNGGYQLPAENLFKQPLSLGTAGQGLTANDLAVGASENSIVVITVNRENNLSSMVFDSRGTLLSAAKPVEPILPRRDVQIGQNIAMILLVLLMTLSLWQWRQKTVPLALPTGTIIAPLHLRGLAAFIDMVIPYIIVLFIFNAWENGGYTEMAASWLALLSHPEDMAKTPSLFVFLGIYLGHVTFGELFFRRSLGKALTGLQVLMLDGKSPTVAAILVRNLIRIPEAAVGVMLLYMLISERRQRLGDLLSRTVVIAQPAPETPADPDK